MGDQKIRSYWSPVEATEMLWRTLEHLSGELGNAGTLCVY